MLPHLFTPETDKTTHYWFAFCMPKTPGEFGRQAVEDQVESLRFRSPAKTCRCSKPSSA
jgi:vanillate O-demethylase monooxygenase subunit